MSSPAPYAYVDCDYTGTRDAAAAFNAALATLPVIGGQPAGVIEFGPGTVRVDEARSLDNPGPAVYVKGAGLWATTIMFYGTGDLFRVWNPHYTTSAIFGGGITGLSLDGTNAGPGSAGLHAGDLLQYRLDIGCHHWAGTGSMGVHFDNQVLQTEQITGRIWAQACAAHVVFDVAPGAQPGCSGSFDRMNLTVFVDQQNAGDGVVFQNGAYLVNGALAIYGNFVNSPGPNANAVLRITGQTPAGVTGVTPSSIQRCRLDIGVECDNAYPNAPQTIAVGGPQNGISNCYGSLDFSAAAPFAPSNIASGFWSYFGPVTGDPALAVASLPESLAVAGTLTGAAGSLVASKTTAGAALLTQNAASGQAAWLTQNSGNPGYLGVGGFAVGNKLWQLGNNGDTGFSIYTNSNGGTGQAVARRLGVDFSGVIYIANDAADPSSNPSGGGYLFVSGGALKYRGPNGTVTTVAGALPAARPWDRPRRRPE